MPETVRIAQISDLHCDGKAAWRDRFDKVVRCLSQQDPDVLLITGDLVEHPFRKYFQSFSRALVDLAEEIDKARFANGQPNATPVSIRPSIVVIPGNHDIALLGNRFGALFATWEPFREFHKAHLAWCGFERETDQLKAMLLRHQLAIYPFDSNDPRNGSTAMFARGRVVKVKERFNDLDEEFATACRGTDVSLKRAVRIAILHHHPLPLPGTARDERYEPGMLLDNARHFLRKASEQQIQLILHGHRHVQGLCEFSDSTVSDHTMVVSSCGSSSKASEKEWEVDLFDIKTRSGTIHKTALIATQSDPDFSLHAGRGSTEIVKYSYRRKTRAEQHHTNVSDLIQRVRTKTKIVRLIDNGTALVTIRLQGIDWRKGTAPGDVVVREFIHGGIGRVVGGYAAWLDQSGERLGAEGSIEVSRDSSMRLDAYEGFTLAIDTASHPTPDLPDGCEISYVLFNGYCLSERDHEESFGHQEQHDEVSSIEAMDPTEYLELIIAFPSPALLPKVDNVYLHAWRWGGDAPTDDTSVTFGKYRHDRDEEAYLDKHDAVRHRPELCQISSLIRHPQPGLTYTLRWTLPADDPAAQLNAAADGYRTAKRALVEGSIDPSAWEGVNSALRDAFGINALGVYVYAFDTTRDPPRLRLVYAPALPRRTYQLVVGRGVVGRAFRSRSVIYYQKRPDELVPVEPMPDHPAVVNEILAFPIVHPLSKRPSFDAAPNRSLLRVSGVIAIINEATTEDVVLDPSQVEESNRDALLASIYRVLLQPLLPSSGRGVLQTARGPEIRT